jgi:hypothetical protein
MGLEWKSKVKGKECAEKKMKESEKERTINKKRKQHLLFCFSRKEFYLDGVMMVLVVGQGVRKGRSIRNAALR